MSTIIDSGTVNNFNTNNSILGTNQAETLLGGKGNDTLEGLSEDDELYGGEGNDILIGGEGNDTLIGGEGSDTLIGGEGNDVFQFTKTDLDSLDVIEDFGEGLDKIEIKGLNSADEVTYNTESGYIAINGENFVQINTNLDLNIDYIKEDPWEYM